jgi:tetratricopeptide (TPR) repeat protein
MRKSLILLLIVWSTHNISAQTGLYQSGKQNKLDDGFELFDKHLFSASRFEYEELKLEDFNENQRVLVDFFHAISALKIENPGAADLVNHFIRTYPNHPKRNDAAYILGSFYFDKKNYREAIPAFGKIDASFTKPAQKSEIYFKTGYSYFQLKDFKNALNYFNQVKVEKGEYSADAYYYAGFISKESGNYDQAIKDFKEAEKVNFYANKVPYMLAGIYYQQGYFDDLIVYAEPVLKSRPNLDRKEEIHLYLA